MRLLRPACLISVIILALSSSVLGAGSDSGRVFVHPELWYYITLPQGWRASAGEPYVVCRPAGRSDVSWGIAVLPTTNYALDLDRLNQVADLWLARVQRGRPHLRLEGASGQATYFGRPAVHRMLRGRPARAKSDEVRRLTVITCRAHAYFITASADSPEAFDEARPSFDALLESVTDLSPSLMEKVELVEPAMKMDPYKVPVHDFVLVNKNDFTVDNIFIRVDYLSVQKAPLETCLERVNVRVHPGERLVVRDFQALPLRPQYDYERYHTSTIQLVDAARAFDQGMGARRSTDSIVTYELDLGGARRAGSPNDVIAYCRGNELWLMDGRGRRTWKLYTGGSELRAPAWSPDRRRLAVAAGGSIVLLELDKRGRLEHEFMLLPEEKPAMLIERHWFASPTWVRDGAALFCMGHKRFMPLAIAALTDKKSLIVKRVTKLTLATLATDEIRVHSNPADFSKRFESFDAVVYCSPRSDLVAYTRRTRRGTIVQPEESSEIIFADFTGKVLKAVPVEGLCGMALAWSPDGRHVAFVRGNARGATNVCVLSLRNRKVTQLTSFAPSEGQVGALDWSPDGSWIVFEKMIPTDRSINLFKVHTRGRTLVQLTENGVSSSPAWVGR